MTIGRSRIRIAVVAIILTTGLGSVSSAGASSHHSRWSHPKAHAWAVSNERDYAAATNDMSSLVEDMKCDPAVASCSQGSLYDDVPENTPRLTCAPMYADIATVRADGPIPAKQAQRWWATALSEAVSTCRALTEVVDNNTASVQEGAIAEADMTSASELLSKVESYIGRVCAQAGQVNQGCVS